MSECTTKYEFRQPVEVNVAGEWRKGVVESPTSTFKHEANGVVAFTMWIGKDGGYGTGWCKPNEIRPDPDFALVPAATPRTGWRLPEPGDVVRVKNDYRGTVHPAHIGVDLTITNVFLTAGKVTVDGGGVRMEYPFFDKLEPVRLHDAPPEPKVPRPFAAFREGEPLFWLLAENSATAMEIVNEWRSDWMDLAFRQASCEQIKDWNLPRFVEWARANPETPAPPAPAAKPTAYPALDDVTAARHLLDMVRGERPETDKIVLDAAAKILDRAAKTLAGGAA